MGNHLRYSYMEAGLGPSNEGRHAITVMRELGIAYRDSTPQSMSEEYWFWNCENIPKELPKYLRVLDVDPMTAVGYGLGKVQAEHIRDNKLFTDARGSYQHNNVVD